MRLPVSLIYGYADAQWVDIVTWRMWGLIEAERFGVTGETIDRFLHVAGETDQDYLRRVGTPVIRQVGNYGEIYDWHPGRVSLLPIERGLNAQWIDDGLLYAPDWR